MRSLIRLLAGAALAWSAPTSLAVAAAARVPPPAAADCMIRFDVSNGFREHRIQVELNVTRPLHYDDVWDRDDGTARWLEPGEARAWYQTLPGTCGARRRYWFQLYAYRGDEERSYASLYVPPNPDGWVTGESLRLSDLARPFYDPSSTNSPPPEEPPTGGAGDPPAGPVPTPEPAPEPPTESPPPTPTGNPAPAPGGSGGGTTEGPGGAPAGVTLVAEDFSGLTEGGFPDAFEFLGGSMQVVLLNGRPMLEMDGEGWFRVPLPERLPERFTIAFDYRAPDRFSFLYVAPYAGASGRPGVPNYRAIPAHHFVLTPETSGVGVSGGMPSMPRAAAMNAAYAAGVVPVRLVVEGDAAAVFVDGDQVARLPRAEIARAGTVEFYYRGNRGPGYIGALRISGD